MQDTGVGGREGAIAWTLVLAWHVLFVWMLARASRIEPASLPGPGLQVVYLPPPPLVQRRQRDQAALQPGDSTTTHAVGARRRAGSAGTSPVAAAMVSALAKPVTMQVQALPSAPMPGERSSDRFLAQARQWAGQQARAAAAPADPFADRQVRLPGAGAARFRMRSQVSPADLVEAVGGYLFAPKGYDANPCPRNRSNIGNLMTGGNGAALQQELEFERRHCRS